MPRKTTKQPSSSTKSEQTFTKSEQAPTLEQMIADAIKDPLPNKGNDNITYNIVDEIPYKHKIYFLRDNGNIYTVSPGLKFPHNPLNCFKTYNKSYMFVLVEDEELTRLMNYLHNNPDIKRDH